MITAAPLGLPHSPPRRPRQTGPAPASTSTLKRGLPSRRIESAHALPLPRCASPAQQRARSPALLTKSLRSAQAPFCKKSLGTARKSGFSRPKAIRLFIRSDRFLLVRVSSFCRSAQHSCQLHRHQGAFPSPRTDLMNWTSYKVGSMCLSHETRKKGFL